MAEATSTSQRGTCHPAVNKREVIRLSKSIQAWLKPEFVHVVQQEISQIHPDCLPLQQGLTYSSHVLDRPVQAAILSTYEEANLLRVKAGIFYTGIVSGCSCADDPTPVPEQNEYCVLEFRIDKRTGIAQVAMLPDQ